MFEPEIFLEEIRDGVGRLTASRKAGGTLNDLVVHCNNQPTFVQEMQTAELEAFEQIDKALFDAAVSGNVSAIQAWIVYHQSGLEYPDERIEDKNGHQRITSKS